MAIKHVLKNGKVVDDIKGYVVKMEQASAVYALMDKINQSQDEKKKRRNKQIS